MYVTLAATQKNAVIEPRGTRITHPWMSILKSSVPLIRFRARLQPPDGNQFANSHFTEISSVTLRACDQSHCS
jgi:hypothetical protein